MGKPISEIPVDKLYPGLKARDTLRNKDCVIIFVRSHVAFNNNEVCIVFEYSDNTILPILHVHADQMTFAE